jgi:hypothetical protein
MFAHTYKPLAMSYTGAVAETTAILDWRPECSVADDRRSAAFLRPYTLLRLQWSGLGEGALAHAGSHGRRYANLAMCPATPIGVGGRVIQSVRGGRTMLRRIPARPEQTTSVSQIVSDASSAAAISPTLPDALNVSGVALRDRASRARNEQRPTARYPSMTRSWSRRSSTMTNKISNVAEQIKAKEVAGHVDAASRLLAHAAQLLANVGLLFEVLSAAESDGSLISRLMQRDVNIRGTYDCDFTVRKGDDSIYAARCSALLGSNSFHRLHSDEDSSKGAA